MTWPQPVVDVWQQVTSTQPAPSAAVVTGTAIVAALLVVPRPAWRRTRHVVTIAHEGGHALVAVLCGRRLAGVRLHPDTSGLTLSRGSPRGPGMVATLAAGYPAPGLLGLAAAWMLGTGHAVALLWGFVGLLAVLAVHVRNWFGIWLVLVVGVAVGVATYQLPDRGQSALAHLAAWFLLLAAPRPVLELAGRRPASRLRSDPQQLAGLTHLPAALWTVLFATLTLGGAVLGAYVLLE